MGLATFHPDNIMRYAFVRPVGKTGFEITLDWPQIERLAKESNLPVNLTLLEESCKYTIQKYICDVFRVNKSNPKGAKVLPYMAALTVFETARLLFENASDPKTEGDTGYFDTPEHLREENQQDFKPDGKADIEAMKKIIFERMRED